MRLSFVSDIHGNIAGLADVARRSEQLVVLGDLLDYVDYHDASAGILGRIFGERQVNEFIALRLAGDFPALRELNHRLWAGVPDPVGTLTEVVAARYREVLDAVGPDALLTLGNVDVASVWNEVAGEKLPYLDGEVVEIAGHRMGFVAGGSSRPGQAFRPPTSVWQPLDPLGRRFRRGGPRRRTGRHPLFARAAGGMPSCATTWCPGRLEMYGPGLRESIEEHAPRLAVFGHVHQPIARRTRHRFTECVNVGHFQRFPEPFEVRLS